MKRLLLAALVSPRRRAFDDTPPAADTTPAGNADDTVAGGGSADTVAGGNDDDKPKLSQKDVARIVAEERKKYQEQIKRQVDQLEVHKKSANLTQNQKDELQKQIEELRNSMLTKEEMAKREKERLTSEHKRQLDSTAQERDGWRDRYTRERISREIVDAAQGNDAFNASQFVPILAPNTVLADVMDEQGQPTGDLAPQVKFKDTKDGKPIVLQLSPVEAVKRMKDMPEYANFFRSGTQGGLGLKNEPAGGRQADVKNMTPEQYRAHRDKMYGRKPKESK